MATKLRCRHVRLSDVNKKNSMKELKKLKNKLTYYIKRRSTVSTHSTLFSRYEDRCTSYEEDIHIICSKFKLKEIK